MACPSITPPAWSPSRARRTRGVAITADFEFDVPARFDTDAADLTVETFEMQQWGRITVVEIRE